MPELNKVPHTIEAQTKHLETLLRARQEQLKGDQSDTDFALDNDAPVGVDNAWSGSTRGC